MIHLQNRHAARHRQTFGEGKTWCGKRLVGKPERTEGAVETFLSYGSELATTWDPELGTCPRCRDAFEAAYAAAFPNGLEPIATFTLDNPTDIERARKALSPEALKSFFGPGGGGMAAFEAALRDRDGAEGGDANAAPVPKDRQARAEDIAQIQPNPQS